MSVVDGVVVWAGRGSGRFNDDGPWLSRPVSGLFPGRWVFQFIGHFWEA